MEYLRSVLQQQMHELLRGCARMKCQGREKTTHPENILLVRNLLFSQIPHAPLLARVSLTLSQNSFHKLCREHSLTMSKKRSEGGLFSVDVVRVLLCDLVYAIFLLCATSEGPILVTEDAVLSAVRHLRLCDIYSF